MVIDNSGNLWRPKFPAPAYRYLFIRSPGAPRAAVVGPIPRDSMNADATIQQDSGRFHGGGRFTRLLPLR